MKLQYENAVAIKRELRNCTRILGNPDKFSPSLLKLAWEANRSAKRWHGIHAHPRPFQETCAAYENVVPFSQPTRRVEV